MSTLSSVMAQDLSYNAPGKAAFHKVAKQVLRKVVKQLGLSKGEFTVRSNQAGYAVSGEVILHSDSVYVSVSEGYGGAKILYRACNGQKDFSGGTNHYMTPCELESDSGICRLRTLIDGAAA